MTLSEKDLAADRRLQREYGITMYEYNQVLAFQKGGCAICGKKTLPGKPRLSVDHSHVTGELRGLLCWKCNRAIAGFMDDADRMQRGSMYILKPPVRSVLGILFTAPGKVGSKRRAVLLRRLNRTAWVQKHAAAQKATQ